MKKLLSIIMLLAVIFSFSSCKYTSSYRAVGLVRSNSSHSCDVSFLSLEGQLVFKLKKSDSGSEGTISYTASVEEGEVYIYYDIYGTKEALAAIKAGETVSESGGYIEKGHTVYIIIEGKDNAHGKVSVELNG